MYFSKWLILSTELKVAYLGMWAPKGLDHHHPALHSLQEMTHSCTCIGASGEARARFIRGIMCSGIQQLIN